jgi:Uma2 family endonuclease
MAAATTTLPATLTLEEYLQTAYHPDCDFVDGILEERNVGSIKHSILQTFLAVWFSSNGRDWRVRPLVELRTQVSASNVRVPDVAVVSIDAVLPDAALIAPPLIAIEILSPEDRMPRVLGRLDDFLAMGVPNVWLLDPIERVAYTYAASALKIVHTTQLFVPESPIHLDLPTLFAALD